MANEQDRIVLLKTIRSLQKDIETLEKSQTTSAQDRLGVETKIKKIKSEIVTNSRKLLKANEEIRNVTKQYLESQIQLEDRIKSISNQQYFIKDIERKRIQNMNTIDTKLTDNLDKFNQMSDLNQQIADLSDDELSKRELLNMQYEDIATSIDRRGKGSQEQIDILTEQNRLATAYASLSETQRDIMEGQRKVLDGVKKTLIGTVETAATLYGNVFGALGGIVTMAGVLEHHITDVNKELGFTVLDMNSAAKSAGLLSFIFNDTVGTVKALTNEFGSLESATLKTQFRVGAMSSLMGISNTEAAQLVGHFARMNGGSTDIASDMIQTTKEYAKQNNVIPSQVLSDLAGSAEEFALFAKDGGKNMIKAAAGARMLGTDLGTVAGIAEGLLDFESSMTKELELGVMLGKTINLNKARQLAYEGDIVGATKAVLDQVGGIEAFNRMDYFQKKQTADLLGVSVGELKKMADNQANIGQMGEVVSSHFSDWSASLNMITNKYLGHGIEALGGWLTATGQMNMGLNAMGINLKGIVGSIGQGAKGLLSKGWQAISGGGSSVGTSIAGKATDSATTVGSNVGDKIAGKGSVTESLGKINMTAVLKGAAALVIVAGAVWVFGKAVQEFMEVSWSAVGKAVVSMAALIGGVLLLGALMSGGMIVPLLAGAAAMVIVAGAIWVLGKAIQEMATGFSALGMVGGAIATLIPMIGGIGLLTLAFTGLAGALMLLGTTGLVALPGLMGLSMASKGLSVVADMFGFGNTSSSETTAVENGSISEYQTKMLQKMDELIGAVKSNRDVYIDKEKVTKVLSKSLEKHTENLIGLSVA